MVEMRCHFSVVPVVPHGAANRAGESKGRFQNGSAEMARERERERGKRTRMPGCACQAAVSTDLLNYALGRLEDIVDPIRKSVFSVAVFFNVSHQLAVIK